MTLNRALRKMEAIVSKAAPKQEAKPSRVKARRQRRRKSAKAAAA